MNLTDRLVEVPRDTIGPLQIFYFGFNALEAIAWFVFAAIVLRRWFKHRHSPIEWLYSGLFVLFGLSDVMELFVYPVWLLLAKAVVLVGLLVCRHRLIKQHYQGAKF
jgi:hypothetical protein